MRKIDIPGTDMSVMHTGSDADADRYEAIVQNRHAFSLAYAQKQGWGDDLSALTVEQIMEIRSQPEWKEASGGSKLVLDFTCPSCGSDPDVDCICKPGG